MEATWSGWAAPGPKSAGQGCEWGPLPHSPLHEPEALSFPGLADGTLPSFSMSVAFHCLGEKGPTTLHPGWLLCWSSICRWSINEHGNVFQSRCTLSVLSAQEAATPASHLTREAAQPPPALLPPAGGSGVYPPSSPSASGTRGSSGVRCWVGSVPRWCSLSRALVGTPRTPLLWSGVSDTQTISAQCLWFSAGFSHQLLFSFPLGVTCPFHAFCLAAEALWILTTHHPQINLCHLLPVLPLLSGMWLVLYMVPCPAGLFLPWGDRSWGGAVGSPGAGGSPVLVKVGARRLILASLRSPSPVRPEFLPSVGQPCCLKRVLMPCYLLGTLPSETPRLEVYFPGIQWRLSLIKIHLW